jgi:hypothetical protein
MREKSEKGQFVRNLGTSSEEAKTSLQTHGRARLQKFYSHSKIGSSVLSYNPKLPQHATAASSAPPKQPATTRNPFDAVASSPPPKWIPKPAFSRSTPEDSAPAAIESAATAEPVQQPAPASGLTESSASSDAARHTQNTPAAAASSSRSSQTTTVQPPQPLCPEQAVLTVLTVTAALRAQTLKARRSLQKL